MKTLLGFVAGVTLTAAFFLSRSPPNTDAPPPPGADSAKATAAWGASPFTHAPGSLATPAAPSSEKSPIANAGVAVPTQAPATTVIAQSQSASADATGHKRRTDHPHLRPGDSGADAPLADNFAQVIDHDREHPRSISQWHDDFSAQPRDPTSAANVEQQLQNLLGSVASAHGYTLAGVQCHQTLCEIEATGANPDTTWHDVLDQMPQQPGGQQFGDWVMGIDNQGGQGIIITLLRRRPHR